MKPITGIHHIALRTTAEKYPEVKRFYCDILGCTVVRDWNGGHMFSAGNAIIEVLEGKELNEPNGEWMHLAFATDDPDTCIENVRAAGYQIKEEPFDVTIQSATPLPIRIAFCYGPMGEIVEFFAEK